MSDAQLVLINDARISWKNTPSAETSEGHPPNAETSEGQSPQN